MAYNTLCLIFTAFVLVTSIHAAPATFTIFDVEPTGIVLPSVSVSLKPLGVGSDGATTYDVVEGFNTVISGLSTTLTVSLRCIATLVADATKFRVSFDPQPDFPIRVQENCSWGPNGDGSCVAEAVNPQLSSTVVTTATGHIVPIFTVTVDSPPSGAATPTGSGSGDSAPTPVGSGNGSGTPTSAGSQSGTGTAASSPSPTESNAATGHHGWSGIYLGGLFAVAFSILL